MIQKVKCFFSLICFLIACGNSQPAQDESKTAATADTIAPYLPQDTFTKTSIIIQVACRSDASQSYALYIPVTKKDTILPVIYFFDPHGDGALPLQHYKALADAFHFILIGSNNSKNGNDWNSTQNILTTLFNDTQNRLSFDHNRIYTCGFSGGAKVAGYAAIHQSKIKAVIAAGAGLPEDEPIGNFPFHFTGMAGRGDMNLTDVVAVNNALNQTATIHRLILFDGKHAWPPLAAMHTAFTGLQLDAMRDKLMNKDDSLINAYTAETQQQIKRDEATGDWINAEEKCALSSNMLNGLTPKADGFVKEDTAIRINPAYVRQQLHAQQLFATEQNLKQNYQQQFAQGDMQYWQTTISDLQQKAKAQTPEGAMYQRLLAYFSLAFYSISNRLIAGNQNDAAQHFVTLYKLADATNSEAWYFSALLNARNSNVKATQDDLLKAAAYGFTDTVRMANQPEFKMLSPAINFGLVKRNMKKAE